MGRQRKMETKILLRLVLVGLASMVVTAALCVLSLCSAGGYRQPGELCALLAGAAPALLASFLVTLALSIGTSYMLTRRLLRPVLAMSRKLEELPEFAPYKELQPLVDAVHADRLLREQNAQLRQDFTANVSHELKTPLTSISGYAELIDSGLARPEDVPHFARKIKTEADRMLTLVGDILQLSQLDAARHETPPELVPVDLAAIARRGAEALMLSAQKHFLTLEVEAKAAPALGSEEMLEELCMNLVDNAVRYNRPGGRVSVATGVQGGSAFLTVLDNGIGIPAEAQSRVFERFYRVDKSRSKATGGTGLGLAIVKHIAQLHGAHIKLESVEGKGTAVTVTFPEA